MISWGALVPHPPIIVEGIGQPADRDQTTKTIEALQKLDRIFGADPPETLVVFTPHGTVYQDAIIIYGDQRLSGSLQQFGLARDWAWQTDRELAEKIETLARNEGLPVYLMDHAQAARNRMTAGLDHGVLVPLAFFDPHWVERVKLVVIPLSMLSVEELYQFGNQIQKAAEQLKRKVAVIASGDLSHCLTEDAPARYNPKGAEFDRKLVELLSRSAVKELLQLDPKIVENAAECGFRSVVMLLGALDTLDFQTQVLSYESPFGVGYAVATLKPGGNKPGLTETLFSDRAAKVEERRAAESPLVSWARAVVEAYVQGEDLPEPSEALTSFQGNQAGVFVSLKKHGELRGCIGTVEATRDNIIEEIKANAVAAASHDQRFEPVETDELTQLMYSVDVLAPAEPAAGLAQLDPQRYGVIVRNGYRTGLLLPNLEGIDSAEEQVAIAKRKAGLKPDEPVQLERFEVVRYH